MNKKILLPFLFTSLLLTACSTNNVNYTEEGKSALNSGNYEEAVGLFSLALRQDGDAKEIEELLAEAKEKQQLQIKEELQKEEERKRQLEEEKKAKELEAKKLDEKFKYIYMAQEIINDNSDDSQMGDVPLNFAISHYDLFPVLSNSKIKELKSITEQNITSAQIQKNVNPYANKVVSFSGDVIQISEESIDENRALTWVLIADENYNYHEVYLFKTSGSIVEGDSVRFYGIPIGLNYFENLAGGTTETILYLGSHIEKQ